MKPKMRHPIKAARHNSNSQDTRSTCETHSLSPILANTPPNCGKVEVALNKSRSRAWCFTWDYGISMNMVRTWNPLRRSPLPTNSASSWEMQMDIEFVSFVSLVYDSLLRIPGTVMSLSATTYSWLTTTLGFHILSYDITSMVHTWLYRVLQRLREHWNSCIISTQSHTCMETCILLLIIMPNHASAGWHIKAKLCFIQITCCFADFKHARIVDLLHYVSNTWSFLQRASSSIAGVEPVAVNCQSDTRTRWLADLANSRKQGLGSFKT